MQVAQSRGKEMRRFNIYHRKDGRWEGRFNIGVNENGKPKVKYILAKTQAECARKLKAAIEEYEHDKEITERICKAGQILGIQLIDHLIIGDLSFTSLRECGCIPEQIPAYS